MKNQDDMFTRAAKQANLTLDRVGAKIRDSLVPPKSSYQKRKEYDNKTLSDYQNELLNGAKADDLIGEIVRHEKGRI
jgi:hypothetical protein